MDLHPLKHMGRINFKLDYAAFVFKMNGSLIVEFRPRIMEGKVRLGSCRRVVTFTEVVGLSLDMLFVAVWSSNKEKYS